MALSAAIRRSHNCFDTDGRALSEIFHALRNYWSSAFPKMSYIISIETHRPSRKISLVSNSTAMLISRDSNARRHALTFANNCGIKRHFKLQAGDKSLPPVKALIDKWQAAYQRASMPQCRCSPIATATHMKTVGAQYQGYIHVGSQLIYRASSLMLMPDRVGIAQCRFMTGGMRRKVNN